MIRKTILPPPTRFDLQALQSKAAAPGRSAVAPPPIARRDGALQPASTSSKTAGSGAGGLPPDRYLVPARRGGGGHAPAAATEAPGFVGGGIPAELWLWLNGLDPARIRLTYHSRKSDYNTYQLTERINLSSEHGVPAGARMVRVNLHCRAAYRAAPTLGSIWVCGVEGRDSALESQHNPRADTLRRQAMTHAFPPRPVRAPPLPLLSTDGAPPAGFGSWHEYARERERRGQ